MERECGRLLLSIDGFCFLLRWFVLVGVGFLFLILELFLVLLLVSYPGTY